MNLRILAMSILLPAATLLTGCAATVYDDERPAGVYGYYEPHGYYDRSPRYYHGAYYDRAYVHNDRSGFNRGGLDRGRPEANRGRPDYDRGHPAAIRGPAPRPVMENNHHESAHIEAGARPDGDGR